MRFTLFLLILVSISGCRDCKEGAVIYLAISNDDSEGKAISVTPAYREVSYYVDSSSSVRIAHAWQCRLNGGQDSFWLTIRIGDNQCFHIHRTCSDRRDFNASCDADQCESDEAQMNTC
ncbi:hypothetical protein [Pseudobacteriovorax antillogorgiicola]|uniref:Uncharacterized protein n=1 Tax=Pseudobacteriovorax antillogorgiicola TaxID=1513793 RepID=A0A1Y6CEP2_9BACT|nr:hypothetical protein [Pseudobacteriovorax antillogorgiicola]TCS48257.1 hypothetical protein EDD56_11837 [Pseudobacteriovorax antillogorgiicola]SMF57190.1 hypothetical protein SAMN06296036_118104 [Pseudobacteriovorax antillogorgiicola]